MQSEEIKQVPESNGDETQILGLSARGFVITVIKMLRALLEKINNMQEQMDKISRRWKYYGRIKRKCLKKTRTEKKNTFEAIITRFNMAEKKINEFGDRSICISQPEMQRERRIKQQQQTRREKQKNKNKKQDRTSKNCGIVKANVSIICNYSTRE